MNQILSTDSYKFSHFMQYPPGTTDVSSYIEARGTKLPNVKELVFLGLQSYIKDRLMKPVTMADVREAETFCSKHGVPFNVEGWTTIVRDHGGFLPIKITAVPEGTVVPLGNMLVQVHTLDERLPWLTSYVETDILRYVWYPSTVGTVSREIKKIIKAGLDVSSDIPDVVLPFKLHDFGYRGVSSTESAARGGFAHLVNFLGTDTVAGIEHAIEFYDADVCAYSISASEHSTMTSWGQDYEYEAYANMVKQYAKKGAIFACVIDSYDTLNAIDLWTLPQRGQKSLTDQVKEAGATVVLRPDSGHPVDMPVLVVDTLLRRLRKEGKVNEKGFAVLPDHVRVIQGDGIDMHDVKNILDKLIAAKNSTENIGFGMGGGLLQKCDRDTFKFAMKCNAIEIDGEWRAVFKDPITDKGKASKRGRQVLLRHKETKEFVTVRVELGADLRLGGWISATEVMFSSYAGTVRTNFTTLDKIRERAAL